MNTQNETITIRIDRTVSPDLALRCTAKEFCEKLETMESSAITIDFRDVKSITRSFAQEYLKYKRKSRKNIEEMNVPDNVVKMFKAIRNTRSRKQIVDMDSLSVIHV